MAPMPRNEVFSPGEVAIVHVVNRVVRRCFLLSDDRVAGRFKTKEILEAIVYPSHAISDQYASKLVEANGRTSNGLVLREGSDVLIMLTSEAASTVWPRRRATRTPTAQPP